MIGQWRETVPAPKTKKSVENHSLSQWYNIKVDAVRFFPFHLFRQQN